MSQKIHDWGRKVFVYWNDVKLKGDPMSQECIAVLPLSYGELTKGEIPSVNAFNTSGVDRDVRAWLNGNVAANISNAANYGMPLPGLLATDLSTVLLAGRQLLSHHCSLEDAPKPEKEVPAVPPEELSVKRAPFDLLSNSKEKTVTDPVASIQRLNLMDSVQHIDAAELGTGTPALAVTSALPPSMSQGLVA